MKSTEIKAYERFNPSPDDGLCAEQVMQRKSQGLTNLDSAPPTKTVPKIICDNVFTLFNLINFVLAIGIFCVGSYKNLLFFGVVLCNLAIGIIQEIRAKRTVDRLSIIASPKAKAIRGGKTVTLLNDEIVLDDILIFTSGNQITADCIVLKGECDVNEALLTGESDLIHKKAGDMLFSGSYIVSGSCKAKVEHIGLQNYAAQISRDAKYIKKVHSEIMTALNKIIGVVSVLILPIGALLFFKQMNITPTFREAVVKTSAALVGMIPEGLVLLTSTVLAVSIIRLSHSKVLVQELYCIESLARVDVLCLDKTGTITEGTMDFSGIVPIGNADTKQIEQALTAVCTFSEDETPTFLALKNHFSEKSDWNQIKNIPFSSHRKWSCAVFEGKGAFYIGAPEFILKERFEEIKALCGQYSRENRVLLLAHVEAALRGETVPSDVTPLALILIQDKIRPDAPKTLKYFAEQGVEVKIISGDSVQTVSGIAHRAGIKNSENFVDMSALQTQEEIQNAAEKYTVFGRVTPSQKKQLITALKNAGHTVAMTGDGVNDVPALKEADCSIAMASGSDAARNVSQLVLLNSCFGAMPKVVAEGRRSINNIQRSASLFLVKTIYAAFLALIFLFAPVAYPFMPIQLTLISVMTIGVPSFILALEPNEERIKGNFLLNIISKAIPCALTIVTNICFLIFSALLLPLSHEVFATMCVISTGSIGLIYLFTVCKPFNKIRTVLFSCMCTGFLLGITVLKRVFSLTDFTFDTFLAFLALFTAALLFFKLYNYLFRKIR